MWQRRRGKGDNCPLSLGKVIHKKGSWFFFLNCSILSSDKAFFFSMIKRRIDENRKLLNKL